MRSRGGGAHCTFPIEVIWSNVQIRAGTPHKVLEQLGWGHHTTLKEQIQEPGGWMFGMLSKWILDPPLALNRAKLGFRIQVGAKCGNTASE